MINRLINTLRKRGAHGQVFPVQAAEAAQAAEIIAGVVAQRDELLVALQKIAGTTYDERKNGAEAARIARAAIVTAEATGSES